MLEEKFFTNSIENSCDDYNDSQEEIINLFGGTDVDLRPEEINQKIIKIVSTVDSNIDDHLGDFSKFIERATTYKAPITLRPNLHRKPCNPKTGESCKIAEKIRAVRPGENCFGEVRTHCLGDKRAKEKGVVVIHTPSTLPVDYKMVRKIVKNQKENIIPFSHNYIEGARDPEVLKINGLDHLGNGLFNPLSIAADCNRKVLYIFDSSLMDMDNGIATTNASTRAVGQYFVPKEMVEYAVNKYNVPGYHKVVIADIAKHNISEI